MKTGVVYQTSRPRARGFLKKSSSDDIGTSRAVSQQGQRRRFSAQTDLARETIEVAPEVEEGAAPEACAGREAERDRQAHGRPFFMRTRRTTLRLGSEARFRMLVGAAGLEPALLRTGT